MIVLGMVIGFVVINKNEERSTISRNFVLMLVSILGLTFPVALGYSSSEMPNRIVFMNNFIIYFWGLYIALQAGQLIKKVAGDKLSISHVLICGFLSAMAIFTLELNNMNMQKKQIETMPWAYTAMNVEALSREYDYNLSVLKSIYNSKEDNVEVTFDYNLFYETKMLRGVGFESQEVVENLRVCADKESLKVFCIPKR